MGGVTVTFARRAEPLVIIERRLIRINLRAMSIRFVQDDAITRWGKYFDAHPSILTTVELAQVRDLFGTIKPDVV
jgi:hypothetical protein